MTKGRGGARITIPIESAKGVETRKRMVGIEVGIAKIRYTPLVHPAMMPSLGYFVF